MVRKATGSGHQGASVITLAGENKGASMKVGGKSKVGSWKEHQGGHRLDGKPGDGEKKQQEKEKRTFLSREEAGLVEMSGLSPHERFLCRLTVSCLHLAAMFYLVGFY